MSIRDLEKIAKDRGLRVIHTTWGTIVFDRVVNWQMCATIAALENTYGVELITRTPFASSRSEPTEFHPTFYQALRKTIELLLSKREG